MPRQEPTAPNVYDSQADCSAAWVLQTAKPFNCIARPISFVYNSADSW